MSTRQNPVRNARKTDPVDADVFTVEKVLDKRIIRGKEEFYIKWQGFPMSEASWEPRDNLSCDDLILQFEQRKPMPGARKRNWQVMNEMPSSSASPSAPKLSPAALNAFFNRPDSIESWRGKTLRTIHGITKAPGELHFLCKFNDESMHLVPASEANERFPDRVIRFYESRLALEDVDIQ